MMFDIRWVNCMGSLPLPSARRGLALLLSASLFVLSACGGGGSEAEDRHESDDDDQHTSSAPSSASSSSTSSTSTTGSTAVNNGKTLYTSYCQTCHGASYGPARSASAILSAIASNRGGMGSLSGVVSSSEANDIAAYLSN